VGLFTWIEETGLAEYVRVSAYGYPAMITLHSLGLAIMVGLSVVLSLRVLGVFSAIPFSSLSKLLKVAWIGFIVNFVSGGALFASNATSYMQDGVFLTKMTMVIIGAILVGIMQSMIRTALANDAASAGADRTLKMLARLTIYAWTIGMITGRLIAYQPNIWGWLFGFLLGLLLAEVLSYLGRRKTT
jgi:hypothetical protein